MTDLATINQLFPPRPQAQERAGNSIEDLGSKEFLRLMVAQLENQDPTKPIDNTEFVAQLAQFGTVSGVQELNQGFANLARAFNVSRGYQAAGLVGRHVATDSNLGQLHAVGGERRALALNATVKVEGKAARVTVTVQDLQGRLVHQARLPAGASGETPFTWNGLDKNGRRMPQGSYRVSASAQVNGQPKALSVFAHQKVLSVAVDSTTGQATLNLSNGRSVPAAAVRQFL